MKNLLRFWRSVLQSKGSAEMAYWRSRYRKEGKSFVNDHYRRYMLAMAEEADDSFLQGRIIADFGCGPRGSLVWAESASLRIGIDVLADRYIRKFTSTLLSHKMLYVQSTEKVIPLPSDFIEVLFTLNAMDHVMDFPGMCQEIYRIIKPGGLFMGSFNLEEPATCSEPQKLNEEMIKKHLLDKMQIISYRVTKKGPRNDPYAPFFQNQLSYKKGEEGFLWVKAIKSPPPLL